MSVLISKFVFMRDRLLRAGMLSVCFFMSGHAMAFGKIFSDVEGTVLLDGQPVSGAEVERICHWKDEEKLDRVLTDALGRYKFPEITTKSFLWSFFAS